MKKVIIYCLILITGFCGTSYAMLGAGSSAQIRPRTASNKDRTRRVEFMRKKLKGTRTIDKAVPAKTARVTKQKKRSYRRK